MRNNYSYTHGYPSIFDEDRLFKTVEAAQAHDLSLAVSQCAGREKQELVEVVFGDNSDLFKALEWLVAAKKDHDDNLALEKWRKDNATAAEKSREAAE